MTPEEFATKMAEIKSDFGVDTELAHSRADDLLIEVLRSLGYDAGCDIYLTIEKWYA